MTLRPHDIQCNCAETSDHKYKHKTKQPWLNWSIINKFTPTLQTNQLVMLCWYAVTCLKMETIYPNSSPQRFGSPVRSDAA